MDATNQNKDRKSRRKPSIDISNMVYGKVPPQARELEEAIIGAVLLEPAAYDKVKDKLKPECFYVDAHKRIFNACKSLSEKRSVIDILTVVEELKSSEELDMVGGPYAVTKLTNSVVSDAHIKAHCDIVYDKYLQRELIRLSGEIITEAYEDSTDVKELINRVDTEVNKLLTKQVRKDFQSLQDIVDKALMQIEENRHRDNHVTGVPTGIPPLDLVTLGWQPTNFIVIAARPSIGKSAVAANLALNAAGDPNNPCGVAIFTLEMSAIQWVFRILSSASEVERWKMKHGNISDQEMRQLERVAKERFSKLNIQIDDTANMDIQQFEAKCRIAVNQKKCKLIIIDYLQLMTGNARYGTREQEVSTISRKFKQIAKELNVPLIALSQMNREAAKQGEEPKTSQLRESGAIEQDADDIFLLHEYSDEDVIRDPSLKDTLLIINGKLRDGGKKDIPVKFVKEIQKIMTNSEYEAYRMRQNTGGNWHAVNQQTMRPGIDFASKLAKRSSGEFDDGFEEQNEFSR